MKICMAVSAPPAIPPVKMRVPAGIVNVFNVYAVAPAGRFNAMLADTGEEIWATVLAVVKNDPAG